MNKFIDELIDRYPKLESIKKDIELLKNFMLMMKITLIKSEMLLL